MADRLTPCLQVGIALKIGVSQFPLVNRFPRLDSHRRFTSVSCGHQQAHGGGRGWLQAKPKMKYNQMLNFTELGTSQPKLYSYNFKTYQVLFQSFVQNVKPVKLDPVFLPPTFTQIQSQNSTMTDSSRGLVSRTTHSCTCAEKLVSLCL